MLMEQDTETLNMNMNNIANELNSIVGATASSNSAVYGRLIVPLEENPLHFKNVQDIRNSFELFCRKKLGNTPLLRSEFTNFQKPLICRAAIEENETDVPSYGAFKKKGGNSRKSPRRDSNASVNYDDVKIDLKAIGLSTENQEPNDVLRLFGMFRKFHYYMNDVVPSSPSLDITSCPTDYPTEFVKPVGLMPCTMNIQTQIKHVSHKANVLCYNLLEKLDEFKLVDREKYIECSRSIFTLRKMIKHLEPFRKAEFEHKNAVFINSFGAAQAKNLEILLAQIINKIRECNIFVEVYRWSVKKNFLVQSNNLPGLETLKKAVAIAGAILKENSFQTFEEQDYEWKMKETPQNEHFNGNNAGNGDGFRQSIAMIPATFCDIRNVGF